MTTQATSYVRAPYHERFTHSGYGPIADHDLTFNSYSAVPNIPEGLLVDEDTRVTPADVERLHTDAPGCPMSGYAYGSEERSWLLKQEKAAIRISQAHPELYHSLAAKERIRHAALATPLVSGSYFGNENLFLKLENLQYQHSFKVRGAAYAIAKMLERERPAGVAAATAGNHGQGVARAAMLNGLPSVLYMPVTTPEVKQRAARELGAQVRLVGETYSDAALACEEALLQQDGLHEVHPFNNADVVTGQGTIGAEILGQNNTVRRVYVGAGGGGAVVGIARAMKSYDPSIEVVAVQVRGGGAFAESFRKGTLITLSEVDSFSDGTAVKRIGELTLSGAQQFVDRVVELNRDQVLYAMAQYHRFSKTVLGRPGHLEPAGALGLAAYMAEAGRVPVVPTVAVCTGGNIRDDLQKQVEHLAAA